MRIILHAGFHKTGTTSLQAALAAHGPALADFARIETLKLSPGLSAATGAARAFSQNGKMAALQAGMQQWAQGLAPPDGRVLLISSEDFAGHMPGRFGLKDYRAAVETVPAAVAALWGRFAEAAPEIAVLFTLRAPEPWLKSLHWQVALHPDLTLNARQFCRSYAGAADFAAVLGPLGRALGARARLVTVALEDLAARRLGPVEALYDLAAMADGLRQGLVPLAQHNRQSIAGLADQFVRMNRAGLPHDELRRAKSAMVRVMRALEEDDSTDSD